MKKLLSLILALALVFTFAACGNKGGDESTPSSADAEFVKPENYASVLLVTINPQFRLYLDVKGNVLAVEPANDDAKSIASDIKTQTGNIEKVIENIVTATKSGGFVIADATVNLEITEIKDKQVNTEAILNTAKASADSSFAKVEVKVEIKTSVAEDATKPEESIKDNTTSINNKAPETNADPEPNAPVNTHKHSFEPATCLKPSACPCGATEGKALGHSYQNGKCIRCGVKDPNAVKTYTAVQSKNGKWNAKFVTSPNLYDVAMTLCGAPDSLGINYSIGDPFSTLPPEFQEDLRNNEEYKDSWEVFGGVEYYFGRGSGDGILTVTEKDNTITITDSSNGTLVFSRTDENTLIVKSVSASFADIANIPVGTKFTFTAN